ncbi:MAG: hypothetical protein R2752_21620 [Vicinamibacterales bacterium]
MFRLLIAAVAAAGIAAPGVASAQTPPPASTQNPPPATTQNPPVPVPKPFPGAPTPPTAGTTRPGETTRPGDPSRTTDPVRPAGASTTPARQAAVPQAGAAAATPASGDVPTAPLVYPGADYLQTFDAGQGQKYFLFGTNLGYDEVVQYYKNLMRNGGDRISEEPNMQRFDLGDFDSRAMAYPPSVVVKDYTWNGQEGYLFVDGTTPKRYRTVIQIVPAAGR